MFISLVADFTMLNQEIVRGAQANSAITLNLLLTRAKLKILVQMSISLFLKSYGRSYGEFSEPGFPHNFAPKK